MVRDCAYQLDKTREEQSGQMLQRAMGLSGSRISGAFLIALALLCWIFMRVVPRLTHNTQFESMYGWMFLCGFFLFLGIMLLVASL
jgi:hypothetical protein